MRNNFLLSCPLTTKNISPSISWFHYSHMSSIGNSPTLSLTRSMTRHSIPLLCLPTMFSSTTCSMPSNGKSHTICSKKCAKGVLPLLDTLIQCLSLVSESTTYWIHHCSGSADGVRHISGDLFVYSNLIELHFVFHKSTLTFKYVK